LKGGDVVEEGKRYGIAKPLSEVTVRQIAHRIRLGERPDEIARMFGISANRVYAIRCGQAHSDITGIIPNPPTGRKNRRLTQPEKARIIRLASEGAYASEIEAILRRESPENPPGYGAINSLIQKARARGEVPQFRYPGKKVSRRGPAPLPAHLKDILEATAAELSQYKGKMTTREIRSVVRYVLDQVSKASKG
jgi:hypothetical protein